MEQAPIHLHETEPLTLDNQYKVAATMVLFEMMKKIGRDPVVTAPLLIQTATQRSTLIELCKMAANGLTELGEAIAHNNEIRNGYLQGICDRLRFIDEYNALSVPCETALRYANADSPAQIPQYRDENMARFEQLQKEVLTFLEPQVLPAPTNSGPELIERLVNFQHQAEYWIGYYDRLD